MTSPAPICILSVGRSGTSLAARALSALGVELGPEETMLAASEQNPKGFWEQLGVIELNDDVLRALGGDVWSPPRPPAGWQDAPDMAPFVERARALASQLAGDGRWAFKDPRTALTLPLWRKALGEMDYLVCLRNPLEAIGSLRTARPDLPTEQLFALWTNANCEALRETSGRRRLLLWYEDWFGDPRAVADRLASFALGDSATASDEAWAEISEHFDPQLRRQRGDDAPLVSRRDVPTEVRTLDIALRILAERDEPLLEALAISMHDAYGDRLRRDDELRAAQGEALYRREQAEAEKALALERLHALEALRSSRLWRAAEPARVLRRLVREARDGSA